MKLIDMRERNRGELFDAAESYARRLIEQGHAVAAKPTEIRAEEEEPKPTEATEEKAVKPKARTGKRGEEHAAE